MPCAMSLRITHPRQLHTQPLRVAVSAAVAALLLQMTRAGMTPMGVRRLSVASLPAQLCACSCRGCLKLSRLARSH